MSAEELVRQAGFVADKDKDKQLLVKTQIMEILDKILALDPANKYALDNMLSLNPPKKPAPGAKK